MNKTNIITKKQNSHKNKKVKMQPENVLRIALCRLDFRTPHLNVLAFPNDQLILQILLIARCEFKEYIHVVLSLKSNLKLFTLQSLIFEYRQNASKLSSSSLRRVK